jgi:hypothetical protein
VRCQVSYVLLASIELLLEVERVRKIARWVRISNVRGLCARTASCLSLLPKVLRMVWSFPSRFWYCVANSFLSLRVRSSSCWSLLMGSRASSEGVCWWKPLTVGLNPFTIGGGGVSGAEWPSKDR